MGGSYTKDSKILGCRSLLGRLPYYIYIYLYIYVHRVQGLGWVVRIMVPFEGCPKCPYILGAVLKHGTPKNETIILTTYQMIPNPKEMLGHKDVRLLEKTSLSACDSLEMHMYYSVNSLKVVVYWTI